MRDHVFEVAKVTNAAEFKALPDHAITRGVLRTVYTWMGLCFIALPITLA